MFLWASLTNHPHVSLQACSMVVLRATIWGHICRLAVLLEVSESGSVGMKMRLSVSMSLLVAAACCCQTYLQIWSSKQESRSQRQLGLVLYWKEQSGTIVFRRRSPQSSSWHGQNRILLVKSSGTFSKKFLSPRWHLRRSHMSSLPAPLVQIEA